MLFDESFVVRGGLSKVADLDRHQKDPNGISSRSANGVSVEQLAVTPVVYPNSSITITTVGKIRGLASIGDVIADGHLHGNNIYHASIYHGRKLNMTELEHLHKVFIVMPNYDDNEI